MTEAIDTAKGWALLEKATSLPWERIPEQGLDNFANSIYGPAGDFEGLLIARFDQNGSHDDAALAVFAVNALPSLLAVAERQTKLDEAVASIRQWCDAYPLDVFPEPDLKRAHEVLQAAGMTLDAISASNMRHVLNGIRALLPAPESEKDSSDVA